MSEDKQNRKPIIVPMPVPKTPEAATDLRAHPVINDIGRPCCIICGGTTFAHGPGGRKSRSGAWPRCEGCQSLERHRLLRKLWVQIPEEVLAQSQTLQFSPDLSTTDEWFKSFELSIYGGQNSIDLENIDRPDNQYDIIICNHVLEHIPDDRKAFAELFRVLSPNGFIEVTVPNPYLHKKTNDWGYPKEKDHEHYRIYGADIAERFAETVPEALMHRVECKDDVTGMEDYVYFWAKTPETLANLKIWIP